MSISGPWSSKLHLHTESRSSRTSGEHGSLRRLDHTDLNCQSLNNGLPWGGQWHSRTKWPQEWFPVLNLQVNLSFTCLSRLSEGASLFPQAFLSLGQLPILPYPGSQNQSIPPPKNKVFTSFSSWKYLSINHRFCRVIDAGYRNTSQRKTSTHPETTAP